MRNLRNCCFHFAEIRVWYYVLLQTKEKCYDMQEKVKTIQPETETKPKPNLEKEKKSQVNNYKQN